MAKPLRKTKHLDLKMTEAEHNELKSKAKAEGLTITQYIYKCCEIDGKYNYRTWKAINNTPTN